MYVCVCIHMYIHLCYNPAKPSVNTYVYTHISRPVYTRARRSCATTRSSSPRCQSRRPGLCGSDPVSITRFPLRRFSPGAGLLRNRFFSYVAAKTFQGLGPKRRESCNGDRVHAMWRVAPAWCLFFGWQLLVQTICMIRSLMVCVV